MPNKQMCSTYKCFACKGRKQVPAKDGEGWHLIECPVCHKRNRQWFGCRHRHKTAKSNENRNKSNKI